MTMDEYIKNELLCFLQQKSSVLKFDDLVTITAGVYSADEIKGALACITEASGQRIPTYKGGDKDRKTVVDILKIVLNPEVTLPTYVAVNISRLPPVDVDHIDMLPLCCENYRYCALKFNQLDYCEQRWTT